MLKSDLGDKNAIINPLGNYYVEYPKDWDLYGTGSGSSRRIFRAPAADGRKDPGLLSVKIRINVEDRGLVDDFDHYKMSGKRALSTLGCEIKDEKEIEFKGYPAYQFSCEVEDEYVADSLSRKNGTDSKSKGKYTIIEIKASEKKFITMHIIERDNCGDVYKKQIDEILDSFILLDKPYEELIGEVLKNNSNENNE